MNLKLLASLFITLCLTSCYYVGVGYSSYVPVTYTTPVVETRVHHVTRTYNCNRTYNNYNYGRTSYYRFSGSPYLYEYKDLPTCVRVQVW